MRQSEREKGRQILKKDGNFWRNHINLLSHQISLQSQQSNCMKQCMDIMLILNIVGFQVKSGTKF